MPPELRQHLLHPCCNLRELSCVHFRPSSSSPIFDLKNKTTKTRTNTKVAAVVLVVVLKGGGRRKGNEPIICCTPDKKMK
jgi:hypothetical protein